MSKTASGHYLNLSHMNKHMGGIIAQNIVSPTVGVFETHLRFCLSNKQHMIWVKKALEDRD